MVQSYGHDEELTSAVAGYLTRALTAGGSAVLVATPAHGEATGWPWRDTRPARRSRLATDVALVVSELAANAALHARTAFTVSAALSEDGVYLSVTDQQPLPEGRDTCPSAGITASA